MLARHRTQTARHRAATAAADARIEARRAAEAEQGARILAALATTRPELSGIPILALPSGARSQRTLDGVRRDAYRNHLAAQLERARRPVSPDETEDAGYERLRSSLYELTAHLAARPELAGVGQALCAFCRGGCCPQGGDHAFLSAADLLRVLRARPDWDDETLLAAYLSHLPRRAAEGSCINHGADGCTLPRDLRSDTCNAFQCDQLAALGRQRTGHGRLRVLAIRRDYDYWNRGEAAPDAPILAIGLVDESGAESLPLHLKDG